MLTVITPATNTRLTTVAAVRDQFSISTTDLDDAKVETLIDRASAMAVAFCGRPFAKETVRQLAFLQAPAQTIVLERSPVDAASLTVTESGTALVKDTDFYLVADRPILFRMDSGRPSLWSRATIQIDYDAGYVLPDDVGTRTLPADVETAVLYLAGDILQVVQRGEGGILKRERVDGLGDQEWYMPGAASRMSNPVSEILLAPYRKVAI